MDVCIVGYGRVGRATALNLKDHRLSITVFDSSSSRVEQARSDGFEARLADSTNASTAYEIASLCDVAATALPSRIAEKVISLLIRARASRIVDVSYVRDPLVFNAEAYRNNVKLFVDAGLAPGLSNMLLAHGLRGLDEVERAIISVGGISGSPKAPLGLVASWSLQDLLEEYLRPARARIDGREVYLSPLQDYTVVDIPGVGSFEALPTDGLRTLLKSFPHVRTMIEYTLRYRGHVTAIKLLQELGLLEERHEVIGGCSVSPQELLAKVLEERLPKEGDRVILYVTVEGMVSGKKLAREYILDTSQEKLGVKMPALTFLTGLVHAWFVLQALKGKGHPGVNAPEEMVDNIGSLLNLMRKWGVHIEKRECIEEYE